MTIPLGDRSEHPIKGQTEFRQSGSPRHLVKRRILPPVYMNQIARVGMLRATPYQALTTFPAFRHFAQTLIRRTVPFWMALTVWILGRKRRFVTPVVFNPMPPFFFGKPRRAILLPATGPFPQMEQTLDIPILQFLSHFRGTYFTFFFGLCNPFFAPARNASVLGGMKFSQFCYFFLDILYWILYT
jgi:hypothetical protein